MNVKNTLSLLLFCLTLSLSAQTQNWQWIKAGGSNTDNNAYPLAAECKIGGCDARGNIYAAGSVNGANMQFDTFSSGGSFSVTGAGISYLLFSYDCSGRMRWAKQIGDERGDLPLYDVTTDPQGNTYLASNFDFGNSNGLTKLFLGDTTIAPFDPVLNQKHLCIAKFDSLGKLVWFKNYESDSVYNNQHNYAYGLRIGSSGHLWMACFLDSNYAISPNLHTTKKGKYCVEVNPINGNILSGYYTSNSNFNNSYNPNDSWDIDGHENYYETGTFYVGDSLILKQNKYSVNTVRNYTTPFVYSLDKHGDFRFILRDTSNVTLGALYTCRFDMKAHQLISTLQIDSVAIFGRDTFKIHSNRTIVPYSNGLLSVDTNGSVLWGKFITDGLAGPFQNVLTSNYAAGFVPNGTIVYNNTDTMKTAVGTCVSNCGDFYMKVLQIDRNGNYVTSHTAHLGNINQNVSGGGDAIRSGATDWRGNLYLGGSITNFMSTPADSVRNTDGASGNFFIAKIGISDCSCPTPGAQFAQTAKGDTVHFFGTSINHRDSIHWRFGDGTVSNADSLTHIYTHDGAYTVTAIAYSGCGVDSITRQITVTSVGITTVEPLKTMIYPNPAKSTINVQVSGAAMIGLVFANGSSVWDNPVQVINEGVYVFDMSKYASALYYFIVEYTNGKTEVMPIIKD
jgi:PKD repeat protein